MSPVPAAVERRVREAARNRCGFCRASQNYVYARLEIEHIVPKADGGGDDESNLWLACPFCNRHKSDKRTAVDPKTGSTVPLFNPRTQIWSDHFRWNESNPILLVGLTTIGRATIAALQMNTDEDALEVRRNWVTVGWHPPTD